MWLPRASEALRADRRNSDANTDVAIRVAPRSLSVLLAFPISQRKRRARVGVRHDERLTSRPAAMLRGRLLRSCHDCMTETVVTRFAPSPDRLPAYRRRPHRAVQLALCPPLWRQDAAADRGHRPRALHRRRRSTPSSTGCPGSASIGTATPSTSSPARARHREVAEQLLAAGKAYRCYASPEELTEMREAARARGPVQAL